MLIQDMSIDSSKAARDSSTMQCTPILMIWSLPAV